MSNSTHPITLCIEAIPTRIADEARRSMIDAFGHQLHITTVQAPCRYCLRISPASEEMILMSYRVLPDTNPYAEVGPIFIHAALHTD